MWIIREKNFDVLGRCRTREGNIKLAVRKYRFPKVDPDMVKALTLRLVNSQREGKLNGKLTSVELDGEVEPCE